MTTLLAESNTDLTPAVGRRFTKDVIRTGKFKHPITGEIIDVTPERLAHWEKTFADMKRDGWDVEVTKDHGSSADDVLGYVDNLFVDGDKLLAALTMSNDDGVKLAGSVKNVSVEIKPEYKKGDGKTYKDAISRVSIVQEPVVSGQSSFQALSAKIKHQDIYLLSAVAGGAQPPKENKMDGTPNPENKGNLNDFYKKLATGCGVSLAADATEGDAQSALLKAVEDLAKRVRELEGHEIREGEEVEKSPEMMALSARVMKSEHRAMSVEVDRLAREGKITPAVASQLKTALGGESGKINTIMLSATATGTVPWEGIVAALDKAEPVVTTGSATGTQHLSALPNKANQPNSLQDGIDFYKKVAPAGMFAATK